MNTKNKIDALRVEGVDARHLSDGDTLILKKEHESILLCCCDCGLWHEVDVSSRDHDINLTFTRIDGEPDFSGYEIETEVVTAEMSG